MSETLVSCRGGGGGKDYETVSGEAKGGGFFACYLLTSLSPRHKGHTYIGFTVNPRRRIRQHNGELRSGAWRTKTKRPWEMVLCICRFPTNVSALQFEWAWQHPTESLAVRKAAASFKSLSGLANKIKLGYTMLALPAWQNLQLTVNFFTTKYTKHSAGCPSLPEQMRVRVGSMDELPCYTGSYNIVSEDEDDWDDDDEICNKTSSAYGSEWKSIEETLHDQNGRVEDSGDLLSSTDDQRLEVLSSFLPSTFRALEALEDRDLFAMVEESRVELDQPASEKLPTIRATDTDQPPIRSPIVPCEVEFIDLLSPSPGYRKRRVSNVCPKIIDLTKSPIFV